MRYDSIVEEEEKDAGIELDPNFDAGTVIGEAIATRMYFAAPSEPGFKRRAA